MEVEKELTQLRTALMRKKEVRKKKNNNSQVVLVHERAKLNKIFDDFSHQKKLHQKNVDSFNYNSDQVCQLDNIISKFKTFRQVDE
jgi:hypothetical protein